MEVARTESEIIGGTIGGKYEVVRLLGTGGMGAVYEARNKWTGRRVAIKRLLPVFAQNADLVRRFMQEAQATTQISHPHIVDVLDMGQEASDGSLYIVQEFLEGVDLRTFLAKRRRVPLSEALAILLPMMDALEAAHARGIVHRDVKPENIFLTTLPNGEIISKLIDFGVSKVTLDGTGDERTRTKTGVAVGTPDYMAPEQARGDTTVDARADVWSIAVVLYELLSGRTPFIGASANIVIAKIITERPPRIELFATDVPKAVADIIHNALEPDRDKRTGSMQELMVALQQSGHCPHVPHTRTASGRIRMSLPDLMIPAAVPLGDTQVSIDAPHARISGAIERTPGTTDPDPTSVDIPMAGAVDPQAAAASPVRRAAARSRSRRRQVPWAIAAVAFVVIAGIGAWIGFRSGQQVDPARGATPSEPAGVGVPGGRTTDPGVPAPMPTAATTTVPTRNLPTTTATATATATATTTTSTTATTTASTATSTDAATAAIPSTAAGATVLDAGAAVHPTGRGTTTRHSILRPLGRYSVH